jgi:hypothetical protein
VAAGPGGGLMAVSGAWRAGAVGVVDYDGAAKWGTGINPVHGTYNNQGRPTTSREPLVHGDPQTDAVPEEILGPVMWGYADEDAAYYGGEDYRYLVDDHANWGEDLQDGTPRPDRDGQIMQEGEFPQPEGWPSWGPHEVSEADWVSGSPNSGPPGGAVIRSYSDGSEVEALHGIAVPTPGWRGGWVNKAHGPVEEAEPSDPSQYEITTSMAQLHQTRVNTAAAARGTDDPRAPIETRLTGQKIRVYAGDFYGGGGPGTPDMRTQAQDLPYRPWFYRSAALPPPPDTTYGTMTMFDPIERSLPADAGETVVIQEPVDGGDETFGYAAEDSGYGY